jgi:acetyltransferase-like isoleucine patch superfamily enzyme
MFFKFIFHTIMNWLIFQKNIFALKRRYPDLELGHNIEIKGHLHNLSISGHVVIQSNTVIDLGGVPWCKGTGSLSIAGGTVFSQNCIIYAAGPGGIVIGRRFDCGPGVVITSSRTDYVKGPDNHVFGPVVIDDDVIVYSHAVIGPGVHIGRGAAIAAGAVVLDDVPPNSLVGGIPARVLKTINREEDSIRVETYQKTGSRRSQ